MSTNKTNTNAESNAPRWLRYTFGGLAALFLVPMLLMVVGIAAVALAPVAAIGLPFMWQALVGFPVPNMMRLRQTRPASGPSLELSSPSLA